MCDKFAGRRHNGNIIRRIQIGILRREWLAVLLVVTLTRAADAGNRPGQALSYTDFNYVLDVAASMSHVYFATTRGILVLDKAGPRWKEPLTGSDGIDHTGITRIWSDTFDRILFAEVYGDLFEYNATLQTWYPATDLRDVGDPVHVPAPEMLFAPPGYMYPEPGHMLDNHGRSFLFRDVLDDHSGVLWIATWGHGPAMVDMGPEQIEFLPFGLLQECVGTIIDDDGILWLAGKTRGSPRTGITIFDPDKHEFEYIESGLDLRFPTVDVNCLEADSEFVYAGTSAGLIQIDKASRQVQQSFGVRQGLADDNILSLEANGDSLFVGTAFGMSLMVGLGDSTRLWNPHHLLNHRIYDFEIIDSTIWLATSQGLYRIDLVTGDLRKFRDPKDRIVGDLYELENHGQMLWIVADPGLFRLNLETAVTEAFPIGGGTLVPKTLAVNDRIAATATRYGLTFVYYHEDPPYSDFFTTDDGLISDDIRCLLLDGDFIWVGTDRGLTRFVWNDPELID